MPRATVSTEPEHFELKTVPGGFVELRRMPYGKYLTRQEMALKLQVRGSSRQNVEGEMAMANKVVSVFEFKECIVNHNLTDDNDNPLDFRSPVTLEMLDPRVGDEIGQHINEMHQFDLGNSESASGSLPSGEEQQTATLSALPSST